MTIRQLLVLLARRWRLVLPCLVVGAVAGAALAALLPPTYSTQVELLVSGTGTTASDRYQNGEYLRNRITSYAQMVDTPIVVGSLRDALRLPPGDPVVQSIDATNPVDSQIIDVSIADGSRARVEAVAATIGPVLDRVVSQIESTQNGSASPVRIRSLDLLPRVATGPSMKLYGLMGFAVGLLAGLGLALLRESRRARPARSRFAPGPVAARARERSWVSEDGGSRTDVAL